MKMSKYIDAFHIDRYYLNAQHILRQMPTSVNYRQEWWNNLTDSEKAAVKSFDYFDADIFKKFTGIDV